MKSEKIMDINIDPEEPILSISDTFRAIGTVLGAPYQKTFNDPPFALVLKYVPSYRICMCVRKYIESGFVCGDIIQNAFACENI